MVLSRTLINPYRSKIILRHPSKFITPNNDLPKYICLIIYPTKYDLPFLKEY